MMSKYKRDLLCHLLFIMALSSLSWAYGADNELEMIKRRGPNDVMIASNSVWMPVNRILLIRKDSQVGAIKFITDGFFITKRFRYAEYEEYSCKDLNRSFSSNNTSRNKRTATALFLISPLFFGNFEIRCGPINLFWSGGRNVHFFKGDQYEGDYGIELAPTPWTDIAQVNLSDPHIKWYRYDGKRKRLNIPIDNLWSNPEAGK